jgi:hypothetical protein
MEHALQERHNREAWSLVAPVIKLRFGSSQRTEWRLSPAQAGVLFTVGGAERCDWQVRAAGVGEEELTFFYSGHHLFVKSERAQGARLNGQHLRTDWVAIRGPVRIDVGTATLDIVTPVAESERIESEITGVQRIVTPGRRTAPTGSHRHGSVPQRTQPVRGARVERNANTLHNEWAERPERTPMTRSRVEPLREKVLDAQVEESTLPSMIVSAEAFNDADTLPSIMVEPRTNVIDVPARTSAPAQANPAASTVDTILVLRPEQRRRRVNVWDIAGSEAREAPADRGQAVLPPAPKKRTSSGMRIALIVSAFLVSYAVWVVVLERL